MFVPLTQNFITCVRRLISFPNKIPHASQYIDFFLRWQHSSSSPVSPSMTDLDHLHNISNGDFLGDSFLGVDCFFSGVHTC